MDVKNVVLAWIDGMSFLVPTLHLQYGFRKPNGFLREGRETEWAFLELCPNARLGALCYKVSFVVLESNPVLGYMWWCWCP